MQNGYLRHSRLEKDEYFSHIARLVARRSTCARRAVGAVVVDKHSHIMATGYNGVPRGMPHCINKPCAGANYRSGLGLDKCSAIHAEQNALMQCKDVMEIDAIYITCSPCMSCMKMICNTGANRLIFNEIYPGWDSEMWAMSRKGRTWKLIR